ncbi:MAG TPA: M48 family metallopeptidase [Fusobacterium sp.]|uniref:M48 family metallopeptidase n=1 Tax=Fusobacterium sp. TaxID=68766 RepID=UPI002F415DEA
MRKSIKIFFLVLCSSLVIACTSTAPLTGRSQFKLISDESLVASSVNSYNQFIQKARQQGKLANNTNNGHRLHSIGRRIASAVEKYMYQNGMGNRVQYLHWEFNLIESKEVNAFAMPGGKIAFYSGIIPVLQTDARIAFVMGHEIGHVIGGHHAEGYSNQQLAGLAATLTNVMVGRAASSLVSDGLSIGLLKFNRTQEYEADKYGMIFMAMAGYDPTEAIYAEMKMASLSESSSSDFLSTHPANEKRIAALKAFLPEAMKYYKK